LLIITKKPRQLYMAQYFRIHPVNPQMRLIRQAILILDAGGVMIYPTDSCYALGGKIGAGEALERIRQIRHLDETHKLTLMCRDLSVIGSYARVGNPAFRLMKSLTPGPYTFLLTATRDVPRRLQHPKRKIIGVRIPDNSIALALLEELDGPILSTSLILPGEELPLTEPERINAVLGNSVELVIDGGVCGLEPTTVVDLTGEQPAVVRAGKGDMSVFRVPSQV
jgi:tRNA threonylcarbamoyl adenosine modification protein (Sua5/YciO/YrdC/YwlC family)